MSEPYWVALGAQAVDYEGDWAAGTQYAPGDVVLLNGVQYLAVNPSVGQAPPSFPIPTASVVPLVTSLPASPFDGQEVVLVDSLTAPTYSWRFRFVAGKASNKWVFVGGPPRIAEVVTQETTTSTTYVALTTAGPSIAIPVAGDYMVEVGASCGPSGSGLQTVYMSYDIGATAAVDADAMSQPLTATGPMPAGSRPRQKALPAVTLTAKYRGGAGTFYFANRWMQITPIAVGG